MPTLEKLKEKIDGIFWNHINSPVDFHFVESICEYVKAVEKSSVLKELIEKEHEDLRAMRYKIPKATNDKQYDMLVRILDEKLFTNCSEDYWELFFILEAMQHLKAKTPKDDMSRIEIVMEYDLWQLEKNKATKKNYYIRNGQLTKRRWQKVHRYLMGELENPELQTQLDQQKILKRLKLEYLNGVLWIKGRSILINGQNRETEEDRLLEYIFSDRKSLGNPNNYAEIAENAFSDHDYDSRKKNWRKYYDICQRINEKIPEAITKTIKGEDKDFLIATSEIAGTVHINKEFL